MGILEVEHIFPHGRGGSDDEANLWLACGRCNRYKGSQIAGPDPFTGETVPLFNPRTQVWHEHFQWSADGAHVIGVSPTGRATVGALQLNNEVAIRVRGNWVTAGWHPPDAHPAEPEG